jgi:hypothetical protein
MHSAEVTRQMVFAEITGANHAIRDSYLKRYGPQMDRFAELMTRALIDWHALDERWKDDTRRGRIASLIYCAISLHIQSMKLFLDGHIVAAGNLSRQVLEGVAMAMLGSGKTLNNLDRFIGGTYGTNGAVRDLWRNRKALGLRDEGVSTLLEAEQFYHEFSHFSLPTIATTMCFQEGGIFLGASFDGGKIDGYDAEVARLIRVAELFPNYIAAASHNLAKWSSSTSC